MNTKDVNPDDVKVELNGKRVTGEGTFTATSSGASVGFKTSHGGSVRKVYNKNGVALFGYYLYYGAYDPGEYVTWCEKKDTYVVNGTTSIRYTWNDGTGPNGDGSDSISAKKMTLKVSIPAKHTLNTWGRKSK